MRGETFEIPIDKITVPEDRARTNPGDLDGLATSMADVGLLQPIVVTADYELIAGYRRLTAAKKLGWEEIRVFVPETVDDIYAALRAERDENVRRVNGAITCRRGSRHWRSRRSSWMRR